MKLRQRELPALQNDLTRQMREMWQQGHLCDLVGNLRWIDIDRSEAMQKKPLNKPSAHLF